MENIDWSEYYGRRVYGVNFRFINNPLYINNGILVGRQII